MKFIKIFAIVLVIAFGALQFVRPERTNPITINEETLFAIIAVPDDVQKILKRSCSDCHSNETVYPWYSNIVPFSWSVVDHVRVGRGELNFSEWGKYSESKRARKIKEICEEVESGHMPHNQYLWIHWDARMSEQEKKTLCVWSGLEVKKLVD